MATDRGAAEDNYMECSIYVEHGACSCSTGVPGNECPFDRPTFGSWEEERAWQATR